MARMRTLKPDFFKDEDLSVLPYEARLLYAGMWCFADREGRLEDRPKYLKVEIFPYDNINVEKLLNLLSTPNIQDRPGKVFIRRYIVNDRKYIDIPEFLKHQSPHNTEKESCLPAFNGLLTVNSTLENNGVHDAHYPKPVSLNLTNKSLLNAFDQFWEIYPKKKSKGQAEKAFVKINPDEQLLAIIVAKIKQAKTQDKQWLKDNGAFIPHPATWLNAKGWEDELNSSGNQESKPQESPYENCPSCGAEVLKGYEYVIMSGKKCCEKCPEAKTQARDALNKLNGIMNLKSMPATAT